MKCQCRFMIPEKQGEKPSLVKEKPVVVEGFYRRAVKDCWKIFVKGENVTALVFVAVMVTFEYFVGYTDFSVTVPGFRLQLPTGWVALFISRGCLFWYYMQIVAEFAFEEGDELPEISMGGGFSFLWNLIKSIYLFAAAFFISVLPFAVLVALLESVGLDLSSPIKVALLLAGAFLFPMVLLTMAAGREIWMVFHIKYIFEPIGKAFKPYLVVAAFAASGWVGQFLVTRSTIGGYEEMSQSGTFAAAGWLVLSILCRMLNMVVMRAIGLFGFHYRCYLQQLQLE